MSSRTFSTVADNSAIESADDQRLVTELMDDLSAAVARHERLAVAISGGVDSTTLAAVTHRAIGMNVTMIHAISPAVPVEATQRVHQYARELGWNLIEVTAGEFNDVRYRKNPVNRCYYCKSNLYERIKDVWADAIASGANLDDLGDYRPGLLAARERYVVHPLIEAKINKQGVRAMAAYLGLNNIAELPAQPCLSSRIETGIAIQADDLLFVHRIEKLLTSCVGEGDIRCRITASGVRIEVPKKLVDANLQEWKIAQGLVEQEISKTGRRLAEYSVYRRGSAFIHEASVLDSTSAKPTVI